MSVFYSPKGLKTLSYFKAASIDELFFPLEEGQPGAAFRDFCASLYAVTARSPAYIILGTHGLNDNSRGITEPNLDYLLSGALNRGIPIFSVAEAFSL